MFIVNVESGQLTRVPPAPAGDGGGARRRRRRRSGGFGGGRGDGVRARRPHALFPHRATGLYAAPINLQRGRRGRRGAARRGRGGRGGARRGCGAPAAGRRRGRNATARQVTYTANLEVDHKALRAQVFNEGWRIMKNRFYDAKMHGANWNAVKEMYEPLLENLVDEEELHTIDDDDDRPPQRVAHRRQRRARTRCAPTVQTRYPGFDLVGDASGYYKVGHIYKNGPADHDYLKIKTGDFVVAIDDHELKTSENYWRYFTIAAGNKFHFLLNDKPAKDGAWEVDDHAGRQRRRSATCSTRGGWTTAATW